MLVTTELRSRAWRSNVLSVRLRRSSQTAAGNPATNTSTSRINRTPHDDVIAERTCFIGCPFAMDRRGRISRHHDARFGAFYDIRASGSRPTIAGVSGFGAIKNLAPPVPTFRIVDARDRGDSAAPPVSRFRSSHTLAADSNANFGIKGTLANFMILVPLWNPKFANALAA